MGGLAVAEREAVLDRLYAVFCTYFSGHDAANIASAAGTVAQDGLRGALGWLRRGGPART